MMRFLVLWCIALALLMAGERPVGAQAEEPIGHFAADLRGALPRFKDDASIAAQLQVASANLPSRGLGLAAGAHWYPVRVKAVTIGLGGEVLVSRGNRDPQPAQPGVVVGATVTTRLSAISPQLSLNFGGRQGWSYISGGMGWANFTTERKDRPVADANKRTGTINYGAGARWFTTKHLALTFDLRFYAISAQAAISGRPAFPHTTLMVFSAGISLK